MNAQDIIKGISPILSSWSYSGDLSVTDSELLPGSVEIHTDGFAFVGSFLEAIGYFCRTNFVSWIIMTDGCNHPVVSLKCTDR